MIYSSITSKVHLLRTAEHEDEHTQLDFGSGSMRNSIWGDDALKVGTKDADLQTVLQTKQRLIDTARSGRFDSQLIRRRL